jgi:hypothetical protein
MIIYNHIPKSTNIIGMKISDSWMRLWRRYGCEIINYLLVITCIHCCMGLYQNLLEKYTNIGLRELEKLAIETINKPVSMLKSRKIRI